MSDVEEVVKLQHFFINYVTSGIKISIWFDSSTSKLKAWSFWMQERIFN